MFHGFIGEMERFVRDYGTFAVFLGILLEDFGLPVPGETMLISAAIAASLGHIDIWILLPAAFLGAVTGDNIGYLIGHVGGRPLVLRYGANVGITDVRLARVEAFFERFGTIVIVFARFVVLLRQFNGIVAGTLKMHWARFLLYNALGAALWVGFWGLLAYWAGKRVHDFTKEMHIAEPFLFGAGAAAVVGVLIVHLWRQKVSRRR